MSTVKLPRWTRQRLRADGTTRLWWEPTAAARKLGFAPVELDADRLAWSVAQAKKLNAEVDKGKKPVAAAGHGRLISDLISAYRRSVHFTATLSPKTRDSYGKLLLVIEDKWGHRRASDFDKAVIHAWYETLYHARGPRMAQSTIRMMSILMELAERLGWRPDNSNPCLRLQIKTPAPRARVATLDEIAAILAAADALGLRSVALAIRLSLMQGQRQTDVLTATRGAFRLGPYQAMGEAEPRMRWIWTFQRSKRKNMGSMVVHDECVPDLRAALAETGSATRPRLPADALIFDEATAKPFSVDLFQKRWAKVLAYAADPQRGNCPSVADLQFRDLRRTFGVLARAAGVSKDDIGNVLGNSLAVNPQLGETYTPASFTTTSRAVMAVSITPKKGQKG